jgi:hypothetical protein
MKARQFSSSLGRRLLPLAFLLSLIACAPSKQVGLDNENRVFTPDPMLPLRISLTNPLVPFSHESGHKALQSWNESPGKRRKLMQCTWQQGLENLMATMVPGTELLFLGEGRDPLAAVGSGVSAGVDSLGKVNFTLVGKSAIDVARHQGWTHMVVPRQLDYVREEGEKELFLACSVAIIDVQEQRIVWQGVVDSRKIPPGILGDNRERKPELTLYEETTYRFILDLSRVLDRRLLPGPENRNALASPCQDRPPLLEPE